MVENFSHLMEVHGITYLRVFNKDETQIKYWSDRGKTVEIRGSRVIDVLEPEGGSKACTVCLTVGLDGRKLRPFLIFKGKSTGRIVKNIKKL